MKTSPGEPGEAILVKDQELVLVLIALKSDNFRFFVISWNIVIPQPVFSPKTPHKMERTGFIFCLIAYHSLKNREIIYSVGFLLVFLSVKTQHQFGENR